MKITYRFVFVFALFLSMQNLQAQVKTADSLVHKIFASLKSKDQKAFVALYPNAQQFGRFIRGLMEQTLKSDEMKQLMAMDEKSKNMNLDSLVDVQVAAVASPEGFKKMEEEFGNAFQKIIEKGESKGVKWNEAKLTGYTVDTVEVGGKETPFQIKGLKEAKGVIDFSVGDSAYQMSYGKMMLIESEGGWFGADFVQLARKGESLAPDNVPGDADSTAMILEEVDEAPLEIKTKAKPKTKTPVSKTKAKTKTPARKPKS